MLYGYRRSPLAYPAGDVPGFDPAHPAAPGTKISAIGTNRGFINILNGAFGAVVGPPTFGIDGSIGPFVYSPSDSQYCKFTLLSTSPASITAAAIFVVVTNPADGGYNTIFDADGSTGSTGFYVHKVGTNPATVNWVRGPAIDSGIKTELNVPYFSACSVSYGASGTSDFVLLNLATGRLQTSSVTHSRTTSPDSEMWVGYDNGATDKSQSRIAAVMYSYNRLSLQQLTMWAGDPWSFWFPSLGERTFVGAPSSAAAANLFRMLMGVGV